MTMETHVYFNQNKSQLVETIDTIAQNCNITLLSSVNIRLALKLQGASKSFFK